MFFGDSQGVRAGVLCLCERMNGGVFWKSRGLKKHGGEKISPNFRAVFWKEFLQS